jgi:hypothetical protein
LFLHNKSATPNFTPAVECSNGPITQWTDQGRSVYEGLLVAVQKRLTHHYQFSVNYALQNLNNLNAWNLLNWSQGYGPTIPRQNLGVQAVVTLPWGLSLSVNSSIVSRTPVNPTVASTALAGTDINGAQALPTLPFMCTGVSCGKGALVQAVENWNTNLAGTLDSKGAKIPTLVLPPDYQFGDPTYSQDFRLTKVLTVKERYKFTILAEVFNAFNISNLRGYNFTLDNLATSCQLSTPGGPLRVAASRHITSANPLSERFRLSDRVGREQSSSALGLISNQQSDLCTARPRHCPSIYCEVHIGRNCRRDTKAAEFR